MTENVVTLSSSKFTKEGTAIWQNINALDETLAAMMWHADLNGGFTQDKAATLIACMFDYCENYEQRKAIYEKADKIYAFIKDT